jgi:hypothetical protein
MNLSFSKWLLIEEADIGSVAQSVYNGINTMKDGPQLMQGVLATAMNKVKDNPKALEILQNMNQNLGDFAVKASQEQRGYSNPDLARYHQKMTQLWRELSSLQSSEVGAYHRGRIGHSNAGSDDPLDMAAFNRGRG